MATIAHKGATIHHRRIITLPNSAAIIAGNEASELGIDGTKDLKRLSHLYANELKGSLKVWRSQWLGSKSDGTVRVRNSFP